ncbi:hypothetical protein NIES22_14550 [Calothrix brevissima NIES-22]|nr:hypothetical protein NIES22_14550 [Calothrix brevissima NIES-22]
MQVYIPENLHLFKASTPIYGKCEIEFEAITGIVMSKEERTTTRVYGSSSGVGSSVSVNQTLWMQFEDGTEKCIDFQNTEDRIARPGHYLTLLIAKNLRRNRSLYIAFLNHATRDFGYFQYQFRKVIWRNLLWDKKTCSILGYSTILGLIVSFIFSFLRVIYFSDKDSQGLAAQWGVPLTIISLGLCLSIMFIPMSLICLSINTSSDVNNVNKSFGNHINKIMDKIREQLIAI